MGVYGNEEEGAIPESDNSSDYAPGREISKEEQYGPGLIGLFKHLKEIAPKLENTNWDAAGSSMDPGNDFTAPDVIPTIKKISKRMKQTPEEAEAESQFENIPNADEELSRQAESDRKTAALSTVRDDGVIPAGKAPVASLSSSVPSVPGPSAGVVPESPRNAPVAQSIKEYLAMIRGQGGTPGNQGMVPSFTNISKTPGQEQKFGGVGGQYFMPEYGRVITGDNAMGATEKGTLNASSPLGETKPYNPVGDPFEQANSLAMQDASTVWNKITGGGVPMESATPKQKQQFSEVMTAVRDHYLDFATKNREQFGKYLSQGFPPNEIAEAMKTDDWSKMRRVFNPKDDFKTIFDTLVKSSLKAYELKDTATDAITYKIDGQNVTPAQANAQAITDAYSAIDLLRVSERNGSASKGVSAPGGQASVAGQGSGGAMGGFAASLTPDQKKLFPQYLEVLKKLADSGVPAAQIGQKIPKNLQDLDAARRAWAAKQVK